MIDYVSIYKSLVQKFSLPTQQKIIGSTHIDYLLETKDYHIVKAILPEVKNLSIDIFPTLQSIIQNNELKIKHMIVSVEIMRKVRDLISDLYIVRESLDVPCVLFGIETWVSGDTDIHNIFFLCESEYKPENSQQLMDIYQFGLSRDWTNSKQYKYGNDKMNIRQFKNYKIGIIC